MKKTKKVSKKLLSLSLTLALVVSMVAVLGTVASAASEYYYPAGTVFISALATQYSGSSTSAAVSQLRDAGYTGISYDLNADAGGKYVVVGYKTTTNYADAIKGILIRVNGGSSATASASINGATCTFNVVNASGTDGIVDLNKGAGGDDLFIYYTKDPNAGPAITALTVVRDSSTLSGYTPVRRMGNTSGGAHDCNSNAGGYYVYMHYKSTASAVSTSTMRSYITTSNSLTQSRFTSASWSTMTSARSTANTIASAFNYSPYASSSYSQTSINNAANALNNAMNALKTTIYFNAAANGGSPSASSTTVTIGRNSTASLNVSGFTATKSGWNFVGWSTSSTATSGSKTTITVSHNQTIYAIFNRTMTGTFRHLNASGATTSSTSAVTVYNNTASGNATGTAVASPSFDGRTWTFKGWSASSTATSPTYTSSNGVNAVVTMASTASAYTFYATYTGPLTLSYNANTGSGAPAAQTTTQSLNVEGTRTSHSFTVSTGVPTKTGYTFLGWARSAAASSVEYASGSTISGLTTNTVLYAVWGANTYYTQYNGNTNTGGATANTTHTYDTASPLAQSGFTKTGYTFSKWNTVANGSGTNYAAGASVSTLTPTPFGTFNLYAQWTPNVYYFKYAPGAASGTTTENYAATYDAPYEALPCPADFELEYHVFVGWLNPTDSKVYKPHETILNAATGVGDVVTLTAQWNANAHVVEYYGNGATAGEMTKTGHVCDEETYLRKNEFSKTGYTFRYWTQDAAGNGTPLADEAMLYQFSQPLTTIKLYAQWLANSYTVVYNPGNALGETLSADATYDASFTTKAANTYAKTGYLLTSWLCSNGSSFAPGASASNLTSAVDGSVTMTAQWTPITYTVTYDSGTADIGSTAPVALTYDSSYSAYAASTFDYPGYIFSGWKCDLNGAVYQAGATLSNLVAIDGTAIKMTAQWTPITYSVKYLPGTGSGVEINATYTYDVFAKTPASTAFTKPAHYFTGWACSNGKTYSALSDVKNLTTTQGAAVTLTAQWAPKNSSMIINYVSGFGDGTEVSTPLTAGNFRSADATLFSRKGYSISSWYCSINGNYYTPGTLITDFIFDDGMTVIMTACWTPNHYRVEYFANGGSGTMANSEFTYDLRGNLLPNAFTLDGSKFVCWNTQPDGSGTRFASRASIFNLALSGRVILYAQWEAVSADVSFETNGGLPLSNLTFEIGEGITGIPGAQWDEEHSFSGWFTDAALETPYVDGALTMTAAGLKLYAAWAPVTAQITVDTVGEGTVAAYLNGRKTQIVAGELTAVVGDVFKLEAMPAVGWELSAVTIDGLSSGTGIEFTVEDDMTASVTFERIIEKYLINVIGGTVFKAQSISLEANSIAVVVPANTDAFSCWASDPNGNNILSYSVSYGFPVKSNLTVYAIEKTQVQPDITMFAASAAKSGTKYRVSYTGTANVPSGYTLKEAGILFLALGKGGFNENSFSIGNPDGLSLKKYTASSISAMGQYKITITNVPKKQATSARCFLVYEDALGNTSTVYSDVAYVTTGK